MLSEQRKQLTRPGLRTNCNAFALR